MDKKIKKILETPFWIQAISSDETYSRLNDDHDGTETGNLLVKFSCDGDAWITVDKPWPPLRFRNFGGGGLSLRTRNALMILAYAIKLDNEKRLPG